MRNQIMAAAAIVILASTVGATETAIAVSTVKPKAGAWSGTETGAQPPSVSFTVAKGGASVSNFIGPATVKASCKDHITSFQAPTGPMTIKRGAFRATSSVYPQKLKVTVVGTFTSRTRVRGRIKIHFKKISGCDRTRAFTASLGGG